METNKLTRRPFAAYAASFFLPALIMLAVFALLGVWPFGDSSVLVTDMSQEYVDYHSWLYDTIKNGGSLLFSWNSGMGVNMIGIYSFYLASPLAPLILLFERAQIQDALMLLTILKVGLCGLTFSVYASRAHSLRGVKNVIFSCMYALMGYVMIYSMNIMWLDGIILLPLVMLALRRLMKTGKVGAFILAMSAAFISQFYLGYMIALFCVIVFFVESFREHAPEKRAFFRSFFRFALSGILSAGIAAALLIPTFFSLQYCYLSISSGNALANLFCPLDLFSKMLFGSYDTITYGMPNLYCGMLAVSLLPLYFLNREIPKREKWFSGAVLLLFAVSTLFWPLNLLWHGFDEPTWFPYRYTFITAFFILTLCIRGFKKLSGVSKKAIVVSTGVSVGAVGLIYVLSMCCPDLHAALNHDSLGFLMPRENVVTEFVAIASCVLLLFYGGMLLLLRAKPNAGKIVTAVLAVIVAAELTLNGSTILHAVDHELKYDPHTKYTENLEKTGEAVRAVQALDNGWYRMENHLMRNANDAYSLDYYGLAHYSSFTNQHTSGFADELGMTAIVQHRFWRYFGATSVTDSLFGVKYVIGDVERRAGFEQVLSFDSGRTVYENRNALPAAYMVDPGVLAFDYELGSARPFELQQRLLSAMSGEEGEYYAPIAVESLTTSNNINMEQGNEWITLTSGDGYSGDLFCRFTTTRDGNVCLYLPSNRLQSWTTVSVNGEPYFGGAFDILGVLDLGYFSAGETVEVTFHVKASPCSIKEPQVVSFDSERFSALCESLRSQSMEEIEVGSRSLSGKVTAQEDGVLFTSIPYDPGWSATIDGEKAELSSVAGAFIALPLTQGEHTIEFTFFPQGMTAGLTITGLSVVAAIVFILLCDLRPWLKKRRNRTLAASGSVK